MDTIYETPIVTTPNFFDDIGNDKEYAVIFHNDDITPFDFVIAVLVFVFDKPVLEAVDISLQIDKEGSGVVGKYSFKEAYEKANLVDCAKEEAGYDLLVTVEEI